MTSLLPAASFSLQVPPPVMGSEKSGTLFPGFSLDIALSGFDRFEDRIEVERVAELHELLAQVRDVDAARYVHDHLHREHRRAGMRRRVAARRYLGDVDAAAREEARQSRD